ncbi:hypothetical protein TNCV_1909421 [Trichonephila clavipes]|nr:hypothetical protein TNCV_1909421 [Trichonephila clavipes]
MTIVLAWSIKCLRSEMKVPRSNHSFLQRYRNDTGGRLRPIKESSSYEPLVPPALMTVDSWYQQAAEIVEGEDANEIPVDQIQAFFLNLAPRQRKAIDDELCMFEPWSKEEDNT